MKKCLVILACLFMLANCAYAKDSAGTSPNSLSGNPDLEMYGKDITGVNRVILTGTPQSSSDAVSKGYVDSQISAIESMVRALKNSVEAQNKVINRMVGQQQILNQSINNMNNSVSNQINSLQIRVSRLENTPPPSAPSPSCPTNGMHNKEDATKILYAFIDKHPRIGRVCNRKDVMMSRSEAVRKRLLWSGASCAWLDKGMSNVSTNPVVLSCPTYFIRRYINPPHDGK